MAQQARNFNRRYAREYNWFRTLFYYGVIFFLVIPYMKKHYNFTVTGRENLPKHKKANKLLFTANHVSELDPPMVSMAVMRPVAYMAKKELFEEGGKREWLVKRLGAFAVDRAKPEIATFKTVKDILSTHWSLGVFPQGGIRPYGKLEDIKKGFVVIAKNAKADILPVGIEGFDGYPKFKPFTKRHVSLNIGKPISYKLPEDVIIYEWCQQMSKLAGYENTLPKPEGYEDSIFKNDKETVTA